MIGIIPGPKEPKLSVNPFIAPLVMELQDAYYNEWVFHTKEGMVCIRARVGCVTCDKPASQKFCGFLGHAAKLGCSKCYKEFTMNASGSLNYAGYARDNWELRFSEQHRAHCEELQLAKHKTDLQSLEAKYGIRYSKLIELPLFDPMHNILLGTPKDVMSTWINKGILTQNSLQVIQDKSAKLSCPYGVGRIPFKIGSSFAGFTADQWRI